LPSSIRLSPTKPAALHQYLTDRRLEHARRLLTTTSLTLTEIALQCGFGSSSHFSNRFRQQLGCTPSSLRKDRSGS